MKNLFMKRRYVKSIICSYIFLCCCFSIPVWGGELLPYSQHTGDYFSDGTINDYMHGIEEVLMTLREEEESLRHCFPGKELLPYEMVDNCVYNISNKSVYGDNPAYAHAFFNVTEGNLYFVSGGSSTTYDYYPLGAFYDDKGNLLLSFGNERSVAYEDEPVIAPNHAVTMVVNRNDGASLLVKEAEFDESRTRKAYDLALADEMLRVRRLNPFQLKPFDHGYVTFVFDDLTDDLDSIASTFEEYGYPISLAAIPSKMDEKCTSLTEQRGSYTPNMTKREIMATVISLGGEVMAHNAEPSVTESNQYDSDFMYDYFIQTKQELEKAGFHPRGIIRAGGKGAINRSAEIERWLIGTYEYSNMGLSVNYCLERKNINQYLYDIKDDIRSAYSTGSWLRFMCHGYTFGKGETFRHEDDLRAILDYCRELGIEVVTYEYMIDHFGSTELEEWMTD